MAAVAGRDFTTADIALLLDSDGRDVDFAPALDCLRRARFLTGNRLSGWYSFAQAFSRDTTYELTAKRSRLRWHLALARRGNPATGAASARTPTPGEHVDGNLLVYHLESAALLSRELHPHSQAWRIGL